VLSEPEELRRDIKRTFEEIGEDLARDCSENKNELWKHDLLKHNSKELKEDNTNELKHMASFVRSFLFPSS